MMTAINYPGSTLSQQFENLKLELRAKFFYGVVFLGLTLAQPVALANENAPPAHVASPDVYKILAENDQFRVIEATWQPGQEDNYHSHPADRVSLYQTDCTLRLTNFDVSTRIGKPKAGTAKARTGKPVKSHKAKNIGDQVCVIKIVELK
jgi:hypothetical protein